MIRQAIHTSNQPPAQLTPAQAAINFAVFICTIATLKADNAIALLAAQSTNVQTSSQSGRSGSIGASTGVTLSGNKSRGQGNGSDTSYTNTHISAGNAVSLTSGGDTTLAGATVAANQVTANVGGNLAITSLQDLSHYDEQSKSSGGSITIGPGFIPTGGSLSAGKTDIHSNYQSVTEQSAISAGDGGFAVHVKGNTTLTGGAITSTQAAVDQNLNTVATGGKLTTSDIQNVASYSASGYSVSASISTGKDDKGDSKTTPGGSAGFGQDSGNAASTTKAGIAGMAGDTSVRTGDAQAGIQQIFDKDKVKAEVNAQVAITAEFDKQASKAVGDYPRQRMFAISRMSSRIADVSAPCIGKLTKSSMRRRRAKSVVHMAWSTFSAASPAPTTSANGQVAVTGWHGHAGKLSASSCARLMTKCIFTAPPRVNACQSRQSVSLNGIAALSKACDAIGSGARPVWPGAPQENALKRWAPNCARHAWASVLRAVLRRETKRMLIPKWCIPALYRSVQAETLDLSR
nr:hemagglutinin repeat-containing protein [uncultured Albidiferax sp.]